MSDIPTFTMRQLLEAGVHFGHTTRRWNPKMEPYLFGVRNGIHIIDLGQSVPLLHRGLQALHDVAAAGGKILFVGTKRQAQDPIRDYAMRCGQYYVNHRWLGGMMTNWNTIHNSINKLKDLEKQLANQEELEGLTKKERLGLTRECAKLELELGGIKTMGKTPDILFVIDTNKDQIAVLEARKMGLPVVAVLDSNSDPDHIDYPIPGNDDSMRSIRLYCDLAAKAIVSGLEKSLSQTGHDIGADSKPMREAALPDAVSDDTASEVATSEEPAAVEPPAEPAAETTQEEAKGE